MSVFLSDEVIAFLLIELIIIVLMGISQYFVVRIMRLTNMGTSTGPKGKRLVAP